MWHHFVKLVSQRRCTKVSAEISKCNGGLSHAYPGKVSYVICGLHCKHFTSIYGHEELPTEVDDTVKPATKCNLFCNIDAKRVELYSDVDQTCIVTNQVVNRFGLSGFKRRRLNVCLLSFQPSSVN